ncbi:hypothetical protein SAMN04487936_10560 [Halobacillus dabanensis]|uniref:Uncharacterized protein n=1 Tax=Halobacillus dabanensis TaxID=240302 RepID=A0A1I3V293_HALDA|nr:hypothetical protein [Halobacillus dabanensis]SFJ88251.1 hypothetical protein SAMN04487936_10560 [Halobacillus dabanensis]
MSFNPKDRDDEQESQQQEDQEENNETEDSSTPTINITGSFNIVIIQYDTVNEGSISPEIAPRAEGGGQINNDVGANANQGGQNAIDHSASENNKSQFADGNGRSGIAGKNNDEMGGQQGIKVRDSELDESIVGSVSDQLEIHEDDIEVDEE